MKLKKYKMPFYNYIQAYNIVTALKSIIEDKETEIRRNKKYMEKVKEEYIRKQS